MIFEPAERVLLPSVDVVSYIFDNAYDANRPVTGLFEDRMDNINADRSTLMSIIPPDQSPALRLGRSSVS
jgi:hypothetical protein